MIIFKENCNKNQIHDLRGWGATNLTTDIPGAQISTQKKGIQTKRHLNPLTPQYRLLDYQNDNKSMTSKYSNSVPVLAECISPQILSKKSQLQPKGSILPKIDEVITEAKKNEIQEVEKLPTSSPKVDECRDHLDFDLILNMGKLDPKLIKYVYFSPIKKVSIFTLATKTVITIRLLLKKIVRKVPR